MSLAFLAKKGFHTANLRNVEKVWAAEEKEKEELRKLEAYKKELEEERQKAELRQLQEETGRVAKSNRVDFLYEVPKTDEKEYLLGKAVELKPEDSDVKKIEHLPGSTFLNGQNNLSSAANEEFNKMTNDPLVMMRAEEQRAMQRILHNPVKMKQIKAKMAALGGASAGDEHKRDKKEKKHKRDKKEKRHKKQKRQKTDSSRRPRSESESESGDSDGRRDGHTAHRRERDEHRREEPREHDRREDRREHDRREDPREHDRRRAREHGRRGDRNDDRRDYGRGDGQGDGRRERERRSRDDVATRVEGERASPQAGRAAKPAPGYGLQLYRGGQKADTTLVASAASTGSVRESAAAPRADAPRASASCACASRASAEEARQAARRPRAAPRQPLSAEERAEKLRQMQQDAEAHDQERKHRTAAEAARRQKEQEELRRAATMAVDVGEGEARPQFLDNVARDVYASAETGAVADRINQTKHYMQRGRKASAENFLRR